MNNNRQAQWLADLQEALRAKPLPPGQVYETHVFHDEWCPLIVRGGPCICNPDIEIVLHPMASDQTPSANGKGGKDG